MSGSETIDSLFRQWGAAVILSDATSLTGNIKYNGTAASSYTVDSVTYNLGPINLYNYKYVYSSGTQTGPYVYTNILTSLMPALSFIGFDKDAYALDNSVPGKASITKSNEALASMFAVSSSASERSFEGKSSSVTTSALSTWTVTSSNEVRYLSTSVSSITITPKSGGSHIYFILSNTATTAKSVSLSGGSLSESGTVKEGSNTYFDAGTITGATTYSIPTTVSVTVVAK
jgi:hypothetical protein